jgi:hypothetical protein
MKIRDRYGLVCEFLRLFDADGIELLDVEECDITTGRVVLTNGMVRVVPAPLQTERPAVDYGLETDCGMLLPKKTEGRSGDGAVGFAIMQKLGEDDGWPYSDFD